jgi:hypothetical protein
MAFHTHWDEDSNTLLDQAAKESVVKKVGAMNSQDMDMMTDGKMYIHV